MAQNIHCRPAPRLRPGGLAERTGSKRDLAYLLCPSLRRKALGLAP
jgi:hypothetical protein